jgi:Ca2+-binding EF-hand superfamily protein
MNANRPTQGNNVYQENYERLVYAKKPLTLDLPELTEEQLDELKRAFDLFDSKGKGRIFPHEMQRVFEKLKLDRERPSIYQMIKSFNIPENNAEGVTFDQFMTLVNTYYGDRYSEEGIRHIFDLFDEDGDGVITRDAFRKLALDLGVAVDRRELDDIFYKASSDARVITYKDFEVFMKREVDISKNKR